MVQSTIHLGFNRRITVADLLDLCSQNAFLEIHENDLLKNHIHSPPLPESYSFPSSTPLTAGVEHSNSLTFPEVCAYLAIVSNHLLQKRWQAEKPKGGNKKADALPPPPTTTSSSCPSTPSVPLTYSDSETLEAAQHLTTIVNHLISLSTPPTSFPLFSLTNPSACLSTLLSLLPSSSLSLPLYLTTTLPSLISAALTTARVSNLLPISLVGSTLSLEHIPSTTKDMVEAFSEVQFEARRPHRGQVECGNKVRALLQGSKMFGQVDSPPSPPSESLAAAHAASISIVSTFGPAAESIKSAATTLSTELNVLGVGSTLTDTGTGGLQVGMVIASAISAVGTLDSAARARLQLTASPSSSSPSTFTSTSASTNSNLAMVYRQTAENWETSVLLEVNKGAEFITVETKKAEEEAAVASSSASTSASVQNPNQPTKQEDNFEGMSEAQIAKVMKKRAEKEAKAAAKLAKKGGKSKGSAQFGSGNTKYVSLFTSLLPGDTISNSPSLSASCLDLMDKVLSGGVRRKPKIAKGTRDYMPSQMAIRDQAFQAIRRVFNRHGAVEIDTPVFELKETLTGKYGEDSKLIYDLADQGGEILALRYDLTVPFARFLALNSVGNIKRFHIGKVYRRDNPAMAKGRYREFYQCDFDIAGDYGRMVCDSEVVSVVTEILGSLPIGDFVIKLNHRRLLDAILDISGVPADKFRSICSAVDKLDKEDWEVVKREMIDKGISGGVADKIGKFVLRKGAPWEMYRALIDEKAFGDHAGAAEAMEDLRILFTYLESMKKLHLLSFDLSLARGLDYYTGLIYEAVCVQEGCQVGSIGGGGRYDNLVSMFQASGKVTPCVGVSVGIERVFTLMEANLAKERGGKGLKKPDVNVLVASVGKDMMQHRMSLTNSLWEANISAEFTQREGNVLKREITAALEREIPFMVILGEEELKEGMVIIKDLVGREEKKVLIGDVARALTKDFGVVRVGCEFAAEVEKNEMAAAKMMKGVKI